ncbi:hypothetical protein OG978_02955 [Streptomyces sp. NBC_01591]|uniref:hypothetical protein n=1 Tax=Streptomyces sp. NBC_01591 TaxID=2975888 RepID=UPI002DDB9129|nr:hypothetical protein [Streptomyces sp. NBC_01591]WSD66452.1 hypothetical protein OG978_02955 [Streptomyces sp. NBC_01591]
MKQRVDSLRALTTRPWVKAHLPGFPDGGAGRPAGPAARPAPSGAYRLGRWGLPVNLGALAYGLAAIVNICWGIPRTPPGATTTWCHSLRWWSSRVGGLSFALARPRLRGDAPSGDAM